MRITSSSFSTITKPSISSLCFLVGDLEGELVATPFNFARFIGDPFIAPFSTGGVVECRLFFVFSTFRGIGNLVGKIRCWSIDALELGHELKMSHQRYRKTYSRSQVAILRLPHTPSSSTIVKNFPRVTPKDSSVASRLSSKSGSASSRADSKTDTSL